MSARRPSTEATPPPHDLQAEEALIGALLLKPRSVRVAIPPMTPGDFYKPAHALLFEAISAHLDEHPGEDPGEGICMLTVGKLEDQGKLAEVGGANAVVALQAGCPSTSGAPGYARRVCEKARRREYLGHLREQAMRARDDPELMEVLAAGKAGVDDVLARADHARRLRTPREVAEAYLDELERRKLPTDGNVDPITWNLRQLDDVTGGHRPGEVWCVAALPNVGKTVVACHEALRAARQGHPVLIVSLEMSETELMDRFVANMADISLSNLREYHKPLTVEEETKVARATTEWMGLPIAIHDEPHTSVERIASTARLAGVGNGRGLVVVDYLQLMRPEAGENRQQQVAELSMGLKRMARDMDCAVLVLSQLRSIGEFGDSNPVPNYRTDLRDSRQLGQDASVVIMLHRPDAGMGDRGELDMHVQKNRNGPKRTCSAIFNGPKVRISDASPAVRADYHDPAEPRGRAEPSWPSAPARNGAGNAAAEALLARRQGGPR